MTRGFSLLEVLVASAILGLAVVTFLQLSSQGLRLLRLSDEYQDAVLLADRILRSIDTVEPRVDAGREGTYRWERRITLLPVPDELTAGSGPQPRLYALSVAVSWGGNHSLNLASLRATAENVSNPPPRSQPR